MRTKAGRWTALVELHAGCANDLEAALHVSVRSIADEMEEGRKNEEGDNPTVLQSNTNDSYFVELFQ